MFLTGQEEIEALARLINTRLVICVLLALQSKWLHAHPCVRG